MTHEQPQKLTFACQLPIYATFETSLYDNQCTADLKIVSHLGGIYLYCDQDKLFWGH